MNQPLVSVICLCYNHQSFVKEAIISVLHQRYNNIEIIVVDDCSRDGSVSIIQKIVADYPKIKFLPLTENAGNCHAFNRGFKISSGQFIIDFSTDDIMLPQRIERQVAFFQSWPEKAGVVFSDATYVNADGAPIRNHYAHLFKKKLINRVPSGNVFRSVLTTYFICSPTIMVRRGVMEALHGYDEDLVYEDFDFWVRASRDFDFMFLNENTTLVRKSSASMSTGWYKKGDKQLHSTYLVCQKAEQLCRDEEDRDALRWRVCYEFKHAVFSENREEAALFAGLVRRLGKIPLSFYWIRLAYLLPLPWTEIRQRYQQWRYR